MPNHDIFGLAAETPLVFVKQMTRHIRPKVMAKLEYINPAWSHYYRVAMAIVKDAEERHLIHPGMTLVDWSFGNSGIALAMASVSRGYKVDAQANWLNYNETLFKMRHLIITCKQRASCLLRKVMGWSWIFDFD